MKRFLNYLREIFGFKRNSRYVSGYMNESNLRTALFMSLVIAALEIWMVIRQTNKYLIPNWAGASNHFDLIFQYTSNFWLLLAVALTMFGFCFSFIIKFFSERGRFIYLLVFSLITIAYSFFIFKEAQMAFKPWVVEGNANKTLTNDLKNIFLIGIYVFSFLFGVAVLGYSFFMRFKHQRSKAIEMVIISLFAIICLVFGIKVSYSDFGSSAEQKQIICFLTMVIYVACLLVFRPYVTFVVLGAIFLGFYYILLTLDYQRQFFDGDKVNYLTFYISLTVVAMSIYVQRYRDATKSEALYKIAHYDQLTEIYNFNHFRDKILEREALGTLEKGEYVYLFINIVNFKIYNNTRGFETGHIFLKAIAGYIKEAFPEAMCCRQADDHFVVFTQYSDNIPEILKQLNDKIDGYDPDVVSTIHVGVYRYNPEEKKSLVRSVDKARYACSTLKGDYGFRICEYDKKMHDGFVLMQYVIHHIDEAIEKNYIQAYYQPVIFSKNGKIAGAEALARWIDPEMGFLSPGSFIPYLEQTRLIDKLDVAIIEIVCRDIRNAIDNNLPYFPVSINFSRLDFELMDVVEVLESIVNKYNVPKDLLHIEITESALTDKQGQLNLAIQELKKRGYALWLDDFGSGYSALNVLKDFEFDVLKIDMRFLSEFESKPKTRPLIRSLVLMAESLSIGTLCEGVETEEEKSFLKEAGCEKIQGFIVDRPVPLKDFYSNIKKGKYSL